MYCSEKDFIDEISNIITDLGHDSTPIYVTKRECDTSSIQYSAIIAIQTEGNNEELIRNIMSESIGKNYSFIGSELDILRGSLIDYIFVKAVISQKIG